MKLGIMLRLYRQAAGLGIRVFAIELNISSATLSRIENGHEPDLRIFKAILDWMMQPATQRIVAAMTLIDEPEEANHANN